MYTSQFTSDAANARLLVERRFKAPRQLVWDAFTKGDLLAKWFAPKPWQAITVLENVISGGEWRYYMLGPNGERNYILATYQLVLAPQQFQITHQFALDETFTLDPSIPQSQWDAHFSELDGETLVKITIQYQDAQSMETIISMGFVEGFTMAHTNLDQLFATIANQG